MLVVLSLLILNLQLTIALARQAKTNVLLVDLFGELIIDLFSALKLGILNEHRRDIRFDCAVLAESKAANATVMPPLEETKVLGAAAIGACFSFLVWNPMIFVFIQ